MDTPAILRVTHVGAATMLLELGSLRLLTDPVFDAADTKYSFGYGTHSQKTSGPAMAAADIGRIDAVLLSHDHHGDNLDDAGRRLLPAARVVLTTVAGAARLGGNARGLPAWHEHRLLGADGFSLRVTATPARHGPPLARFLVGEVTGFLLEAPELTGGAIYITGDTVWHRRLTEIGRGWRIGTAFFHMGQASFGSTGPIRYTMSAKGAVKLARALQPARVVPIHYEGFSHFAEGRAEIERAFDAAGLSALLYWLPLGKETIVPC
jgi:L-ascorbate metabolism protein UlaG (beta-lactamase superfamily)